MTTDELFEVDDPTPVTAEDSTAVEENEPADDTRSVVPKQIDADTILDTIVPPSIDWRATVARHPVLSVAGVGLVGYVVGRTKGSTILAGVTAGLSSVLMRQLADVFESNLFEFD